MIDDFSNLELIVFQFNDTRSGRSATEVLSTVSVLLYAENVRIVWMKRNDYCHYYHGAHLGVPNAALLEVAAFEEANERRSTLLTNLINSTSSIVF